MRLSINDRFVPLRTGVNRHGRGAYRCSSEVARMASHDGLSNTYKDSRGLGAIAGERPNKMRMYNV